MPLYPYPCASGNVIVGSSQKNRAAVDQAAMAGKKTLLAFLLHVLAHHHANSFRKGLFRAGKRIGKVAFNIKL